MSFWLKLLQAINILLGILIYTLLKCFVFNHTYYLPEFQYTSKDIYSGYQIFPIISINAQLIAGVIFCEFLLDSLLEKEIIIRLEIFKLTAWWNYPISFFYIYIFFFFLFVIAAI